MDTKGPETEPQFSQPVRQITSMLIVLALVGVGAYLVYPSVAPVFLANPYLNGFIVLVFFVGVIACFWQVITLISSVGWIEGFAKERLGHNLVKAPQLLAPLASLLRSRGARMQMGASSTRSILDSVATRIDEAREITRYLVNMLIFLGLLGTFYGLATTVPAVVDTIRSLAPTEDEGGVEVFGRLMTGLEAQLGGMGVAFGSSLLGLAGSLILGLLELFAGHGQNRFYRELEEWLSTITRVSFSSGEDGGSFEQDAMTTVLDHMAEQMESLQQMFVQSDISRAQVDERLDNLTGAIAGLANSLNTGGGSAALDRVAEGQDRLIAQLAEGGGAGGDGMDAESRMRLRSIDVQMLRILEEMAAGRQETMAELRTDLAALSRALRQQNPPARKRAPKE
ncbi:MotA/TolQ/ExbB proton channel family protein [Thalassobium sp. R2A62]|jgi:hypothetical protein|uniref:MotA/TolQ/ExbB proton channel family protein n=1 Tax=Thalassobium sp. R2A62 TaxID=633131 RepID=UPI0001B1CFD2|nr:MotA/TolQ/ExbB proton channel family protein [Thalassobium sp. R2A62]EET47073.1 MotA/TolQ/ExbB proton channel family protein [Thalassobium sp. R2A62]MDG1339737.1 biopolymer transporter ExbB [Paracoccaceae bacterium]MDG2451243.1 biopolymer transporter ExbB [Paracoccaceae bacterium]